MCVMEFDGTNKVQCTKRNLKTVCVVRLSDFASSNVEMVWFQ